MATRALAIWFVLLIIAFLNGWFREGMLVPRLGERVGHLVSTFMLCGAIVVTVFLTILWIGPRSVTEGFIIGAAWMLMTVAFELGFGRARGKSWEELFADYNVLNGRVWILVLIVMLLAPTLAAGGLGAYPVAPPP